MGLFDGYSDVQKFGMTAGLGGIGSGIAGMFMGGGDNPYDAASGFYNQIPGMISPYYQPYIQAGQNAMGQLQGQYSGLVGNRQQGLDQEYNGLINNPQGLFNKVASGYHQSPGFQWQLGQGMNAANNAAASGGMLGSPQHQQQAATMATGLANQDYYNYLSQAMPSASQMYGMGLMGEQGMYNQGMAGLQGLNQMGYGASTGLAGNLANSLMNQGNLAFSGQASQNQQQGQEMGNIFGGLASLAAFL